MTCDHFQPRLEDAALGGFLDPEARTALGRHLSACSSCRAAAAELLLVAAATRDTHPELPASWDVRLRSRLDAESRSRRLPLRQVAACLLCAALGIGAGVWLRGARASDAGTAPGEPAAIHLIVAEPRSPVHAPRPTYEPFVYEEGFLSGMTLRVTRN